MEENKKSNRNKDPRETSNIIVRLPVSNEDLEGFREILEKNKINVIKEIKQDDLTVFLLKTNDGLDLFILGIQFGNYRWIRKI